MWCCDGATHSQARPERRRAVLGLQPLPQVHEYPATGGVSPVGHAWSALRQFRGIGSGGYSSSLAAGGVERCNADSTGMALLLRVSRSVVAGGAVAALAPHGELLGGFAGWASSCAN